MEAGGIMDNKKQIKGLGIILCIIGVVLFLFSGCFIVSPYLSKNNKKETDNAQTTSEASIAGDDTSTEDEEEQTVSETANTDDAIVEDEEKLEVKPSSEQTKEEQQSAHEINPDVYEWPCGDESFKDWEEPEDVIYFAKNKELFDEIAKEFSQYEGIEITHFVSMSDGELWETDEGDGVFVLKKENEESIKKLLQDEYIDSIGIYDTCIMFGIKDKDFNYLIYSFDDEISSYNRVNIAPYWWWRTGVGD